MKRVTLLLLVIFITSISLKAQINIFQEDFEGPNLSVTSTSVKNNNNWSLTTALAATGIKADSAKVGVSDTTYLTTDAFSTLGSGVVYLEFDQIAKIEFLDAGIIEVSADNGATWIKVTNGYLGGGQFNNIGNRFSSISYTIWDPGTATSIPNSIWWQHELFNLSAYISNAANVKIRFALIDGNADGSALNYGWLIDNIKVWKPISLEASAAGYALPLGLQSGCGLANETIQIKIANNGSSNISGNLTASFQREGMSAITEVVSNTIIPFDTLVYTFTNKIDLATTSDTSYKIKVWVTLVGDPTQINDTIQDTVDSKIPLSDPIFTNPTIPYGTSTTIIASHSAPIIWATDPLAANIIHTGDTFTTPVLFDTTVYFLQAGSSSSFFIGPASTAIGTISSSTLTNHFVLFDVLSAAGIKINNLDMYPTAAIGSSYTIVIQNSSSQVIATYTGTTTVTGGNKETVNVNLTIPYGTGYRLGFSTNPGFNRNTTGAVYPYTEPGALTITGNTFNTVYAYYFYNWEVSNAGSFAGCPSKVLPVTVSISNTPQQNSGVVSINSPVGTVNSGVSSPVEVTIKNFAPTALTKATIGYSVNGVIKTPHIWTGNLAFGDTAHVIIGSENLASGVHTFKAWTSLPNDSADGYTLNDTTSDQALVCLSGTFTVGGTGADFQSLTDAAYALNSVGICGPVTFNINNGTYIGSVALNNVAGVSTTNTILFQSTSGDSTLVIITDTVDSPIKLVGTSYTTFKNLTITNQLTAASSAVAISNGSDYNTIMNCILINPPSSTSTSRVVSIATSNNNFNIVKNNIITGGYTGIYLYGSASTSWSKANILEDNDISEFFYYGIYSYYQDSVQIRNNNIYENATTTGYIYGIYPGYSYNGYSVTGNKISLSPGTYGYGIRETNCNYYTNYNSTMAPGIIANNFISILTGTYSYGIYTYYSSATIIAYNSINILAGSTNGYALYQSNTASTVDGQSFYNNNFVNTYGGYAVYFATVAKVAASDYNNLYTTGGTLAYWASARANLAAFQSASGTDQNSISVNPGYFASNNLHINSIQLNEAATPIASIPKDIDGELRDLTNPDIGADEITLINRDAGILSLVAPMSSCPGTAENVIVELKNFGLDTLTTCKVDWEINGVSQTQMTFSGSISPNQSTNFTLGTITMQQGINYALKFYTSNPNNNIDQNKGNDTLISLNNFSALAGGTYTIGPDATDDYASLTDAVDALNYGICGPIVFNIKNGTYSEYVTIPEIIGASTSNTVTFKSLSGDSSLVTISSPATTVKLVGADFIILKNLTISTIGTSGVSAVELINGATYNRIENCILSNATSTTSTSRVISNSTGNDDYNSIVNNKITGGYTGIYAYGASSTSQEKGNLIVGNDISNFYYYGIYAYYQDSIQINANNVHHNANTAGYIYGIMGGYCFNGYSISGNKVNISPGSYGYGIREYYNNYYSTYAPTMANGLISNNFVTINTGTYNYGIYTYYSNAVLIAHNSVNILAGSTNGYAMYQSNTTSNTVGQSFYNNNFVNKYGGYASYFSSIAGVNSSDYNNLYTTGTNLAYWSSAKTDLAALQLASGKEINSFSIDPQYISNSDLHIYNSALNDEGFSIGVVTTDIDGELRTISTPDIGADEFTPPAQDISVLEILSPINSSCGLDSANIEVKIFNSGLAPIQGNLILKYSTNGGQSYIAENIGATIQPGDTISHFFSTKAGFSSSLDSLFNIWVVGNLALDNLQFNDTAKVTFLRKVIPAKPTLNNASISYATSATLSAISAHSVLWYDSYTSTNSIATGLSYTTPLLFANRYYYAEAVSTSGCRSGKDSVSVTVNNIPQGDLGISAIIVNSGCGLTTNEIVTIDIYNQGIGTISSGITARFRIGNGSWSTPETIASPISSLSTIQYSFSATANLFSLIDTTFSIEAEVILSTDPYLPNNLKTLNNIASFYTPANPVVVSPIQIQYGTSATISATSLDSVIWFKNLTDQNPVAGGIYTTPLLYDTTTYYAQAVLLKPTMSNSLALAPSGGNICNPTGGGNMFDIKALAKTISLDSMQLRFNVAGTKGIRIYYKKGTYTNYETDSTQWIFHDSAEVTTTSSGQLASFGFKPLLIASGETYGIYAMYDANYAPGANQFINSDIQVDAGVGLCASFASINYPRSVSGQLFYDVIELGCVSNKVPIEIQTSTPPAIDAGMATIVNPVSNTISGISIPIQAKIKNFGTDTLTSADISFEHEGLLIGTTSWTGNIAPGDSSQLITITNYTFSGGIHNLKFWVSNANGTNQGVNQNDTMNITVSACLTGVYTLGTASSDYPTFAEALSDLQTSGICGNVTFKVEPGIYSQQLTFFPTLGADELNRITFESSTGDSTDVIIEYTATGATSNWTLRFDGADFYTVRNMTIKANGTDFATAVEVINGATNNIVENNIILSTGIATTNRGIYDYTTLNNYNTYRNNKIDGGYAGIYIYGVSNTSLEKGTVIDGNEITGFYYNGIYSYYQDSLQITNNRIHNNATTTGYIYGINNNYSFNGYNISGNYIKINPGTYGYGIRNYYNNYYSYAQANVSDGNVYNNIISVLSGTYSYGIYSYYENGVNYNFNNVNIDNGGSTTNYGLYQYNTSSNIKGQSFRNNIFVNKSGSYAAYFGTSASVTLCDYNNYYTNNSTFVYWGAAQANLAALKTTSSKNAHSLDVDPLFSSTTDLHIANVALNGAGIPIAGITTDIDGDLRNINLPDIGADEFDPISIDASISDIVAPSTPSMIGVQPIKVNISNYGFDTLVSAQINWSVNNILQTPFAWTGSVATNHSQDSIQIGTYNLVSGINEIIAWTSLPNGLTDGNTNNDSSIANVLVCSNPLKGVYTIGGSSADFASFSTAVLSLNYCGIDSAVIFNVNPGVYTEKIVIESITGASALNTITFQSTTGDSNDVVLTYGQTTGLLNSTLTLNGTDFVTFKGMTIKSTSNGGSYTVYLTNEANHNTITNCVVSGPQKSTSTTRNIMINAGDYNQLNYNVIKGGYYAVYFNGGSTTSLSLGNSMTGNNISEFYYYGAYIYYQDSMVFRNNYIAEKSIGSAYYPVTLGYCDNYLEVSGNTLDLNPATYTYGLRIYYCDATIGTQGRIFNNNISINSGTSTSYGMYIYYSSYQNISFNNVNITAGGNLTRGVYVYNGTDNKLANNNIVTTLLAYTIYYTGSGLSYSDYNNLYTNSAQFAYFGSAVSNLAAWQSISGLDANSISANPGYYSPNNLHVINPALNSRGIAFDNVAVDIDGEARSTTPDIGSDEFNVVPKDAVAYSLQKPSVNYAATGSSENVVMEIRNFGSDTLTSIPVGYIYNNGTPITGTWIGQLLPGSTSTYSFTTPFITLLGDHSLCVYTNLAGDMLLTNDTFCSQFTGIPIITPSYFENFDGPNNIWVAKNTWQLGVPAQPNLDSAFSAPNAWMTNLTANYGTNANANLYTPFFNFAGLDSAILSFNHKYKIMASDGGQIEFSTDGGNMWNLLGYISDAASTNWYNTNLNGQHCFSGNALSWTNSTYKLDFTDPISMLHNATNVQFRFRFFSNNSSEDEGWLIDDFGINLPQIQYDGGITEIINPYSTTPVGSLVTVKVVVKNFGLDTLNQIPITYEVNSGSPINETFNIAGNGLLPGDTLHYTFTNQFTTPSNNYSLCVKTILSGDTYTGNDKICNNFSVSPALLDAAISTIVSPSGTVPLYTAKTVTVRIVNKGTTLLNSMDVQYKIGTLAPVIENWSGTSLGYGDSVDYTFTQTYYGPIGTYTICAKTLLTGDVNPSNDEVCEFILSDGIVTSMENGFKLWQNIPNPAREITTIKFEIPVGGQVNFELTNLMGQKIIQQSETKIAGIHEIVINANQLPKGIYFYFVDFNGQRLSKQLVIN
jgi:hypothetical protein